MEEISRTQFINGRMEIAAELMQCRKTQAAVGVWSKTLGKGMLLCFVKDMRNDEDEEEIIVVLNEIDMDGVKNNTHVVFLSEIERVYPFLMKPNTSLKVSSAHY